MFTTFCYQLIPTYTDDTSYPPGELYFFTVAWFVVLFKFPHTGAVGGVVEIHTNHTSISQMMTCVKERGFHGKIPNMDAHCNRYQWITNITNYNTQPFMSQLIQWYLHRYHWISWEMTGIWDGYDGFSSFFIVFPLVFSTFCRSRKCFRPSTGPIPTRHDPRWLSSRGDWIWQWEMSENCNDIPLMIFNRHQKWHRNVMTVMTHVSVRVFLSHDRESHVGSGVSLDAEARGTNDKQNKKPTAATHCTSNLDGRQWRQTGYLRLGCQLLLACDLMC